MEGGGGGRNGHISRTPSCLEFPHKGRRLKMASTRRIFLRPLPADSLSVLLVFFVVLSNVGSKWVIRVWSTQ